MASGIFVCSALSDAEVCVQPPFRTFRAFKNKVLRVLQRAVSSSAASTEEAGSDPETPFLTVQLADAETGMPVHEVPSPEVWHRRLRVTIVEGTFHDFVHENSLDAGTEHG